MIQQSALWRVARYLRVWLLTTTVERPRVGFMIFRHALMHYLKTHAYILGYKIVLNTFLSHLLILNKNVMMTEYHCTASKNKSKAYIVT